MKPRFKYAAFVRMPDGWCTNIRPGTLKVYSSASVLRDAVLISYRGYFKLARIELRPESDAQAYVVKVQQ